MTDEPIEKTGTLKGFAERYLADLRAEYDNPFLPNNDYRPRRSHKVLDGSYWRQHLQYQMAYVGIELLERLQEWVEKSRWIDEAGGYEHEPTSLQEFTLKTKTVYDETDVEWKARTTSAQRRQPGMLSGLHQTLWTAAS